MTEPYDLGKEEEVRFDTHQRSSWIERVREADAEAEAAYARTVRWLDQTNDHEMLSAAALIAIASELRAARIARRPGAGQK